LEDVISACAGINKRSPRQADNRRLMQVGGSFCFLAALDDKNTDWSEAYVPHNHNFVNFASAEINLKTNTELSRAR
jgi:hypothetical protein